MWDEVTRLQHEFGALGFYLSAHPLDTYRAILERLGVTPTAKIKSQRGLGSSRYKLAGIILGKQERTSKNGNKFAFLQMSDTGGAFEVTVFSELLAAKRDVMEAGQAVLVEVDAQAPQGSANADNSGDLRYIARNIEPLAAAAERASQGIRIKMYEATPLSEIQKLLQSAPKGRNKVLLQLELDNGYDAEMELPGAWQLTEAMKSQLRNIDGCLDVEEC